MKIKWPGCQPSGKLCAPAAATPMAEAIDPAALLEFLGDRPIGRIERAHEVATAVLWLCSLGASFVPGAAPPADGGSRRTDA